MAISHIFLPHPWWKASRRYTRAGAVCGPRNGSIIVFHDSLKAGDRMKEALPRSIEWLQEQGYRFELFEP